MRFFFLGSLRPPVEFLPYGTHVIMIFSGLFHPLGWIFQSFAKAYYHGLFLLFLSQ